MYQGQQMSQKFAVLHRFIHSVWLHRNRSYVELASEPLTTVINSSSEFFLVPDRFCMTCHMENGFIFPVLIIVSSL